MFVDDNPDASLDEILEHHGVKGMHWGVRRSGVKASSSDIKDARARLMVKQQNLAKARKNVRRAKTSQEKGRAKGNLARMKANFLKNPDRITAVRMTRGEKAAMLLLAPATGGQSLTTLATRTAMSRHIEKKQATGGYDKKK